MENMTQQGRVETSIENGVGIIEFFHPKSNSLPAKLLLNLTKAIKEFGKSEDVKVIVLRSAGDGAFCAGASFDELLAIKDFVSAQNFFLGFAHVILAIRQVPKFVIARVQGKAVGGGMGIACAADYTMATDKASVKLSELSVGFGPFVIGPAVERRIGISAFQTLSINASEWHHAAWAKEKGVYSEIFPDSNALDEAVSKLAVQLAISNPEAMKEMKNMFWQNVPEWDKLLEERAAISGRLALSDFAIHTIQKFKQG